MSQRWPFQQGWKELPPAMKAICAGRRYKIEIGDQLYHTDDKMGGYPNTQIVVKKRESHHLQQQCQHREPVAEKDQPPP